MDDGSNPPQPGQGFDLPLEWGRYSHRLRLRLPSTPRALDRAVERAMRLVVRAGCPQETRLDLEIALREALANAIYHGNGGRRGKQVFLRCYAGPQAGSLLIVRDQGGGFDPDAVPDPRHPEQLELDHGRGVFLMRALMDRVVYRKGGCEVVLFKAHGGDGAKGSPD